ncbi:MAG: AEC family transporter [Rectinemataceae bacterium]
MVTMRVVAVFLLMASGFVAKKAKVMDASFVRGLSSFLLSVALPATVISSFDRSISRSALPELGKMALIAIGIHVAGILFATLAYRKFPSPERKVLSYVTVFSNCGFMGFPVAESVFGKSGVMFTSMYLVIFTAFIWTYGLSLFAGSGGGKDSQSEDSPGAGKTMAGLRRVLLNPGTIGTLIGIVVWLLPFSLPVAVNEAINLMAGTTTPLSMVLVGATLADVPLRGLLSGKAVWIGSAMRLAVMPALFFGVIRLSGASGMAFDVALLLIAMPAAAQSVIFAARYGGDVALASRTVFVSTILSIVTIPFVASLVA